MYMSFVPFESTLSRNCVNSSSNWAMNWDWKSQMIQQNLNLCLVEPNLPVVGGIQKHFQSLWS